MLAGGLLKLGGTCRRAHAARLFGPCCCHSVMLSIGLGIWAVTRLSHRHAIYGDVFLIALLVSRLGADAGRRRRIRGRGSNWTASFYGVPNDRRVGAALVLNVVSLLPTVVLGFFSIQTASGSARCAILPTPPLKVNRKQESRRWGVFPERQDNS